MLEKIWIATDGKPWKNEMFLVKTFRAKPFIAADDGKWRSSVGCVSDEEYCIDALCSTGLPQPGECIEFEHSE